MNRYEDNPKNLAADAKDFLNSEYGKHIVSILLETANGHLAKVADIKAEHPDRYAAKYSAIKEVLALLYQPLDDDIPPLG
jgi:hypothetical protein